MKNIDIHSLKIRDLQPSQFYISNEKIENIKKWFDPKDLSNFESIPIKQLDGEIVITDGHTRLVVALLSGLESVPLIWDEDDLSWDMYQECVKECKKQGILSPINLLKRIVSNSSSSVILITQLVRFGVKKISKNSITS